MPRKHRSRSAALLLLAATQLLGSCGVPLVWNADLKTFIEEGSSIVRFVDFILEIDGQPADVVPSGTEVVATVHLTNPRSVELAATVACGDGALLVSPPQVTVVDPVCMELRFTPALQAERRDLVFTVQIEAPKIERVYDPLGFTVHCNTQPGSVESSLDAALDVDGFAFAAFLLPSSQTDDDLAAIEVTYERADGSGGPNTLSLEPNDTCLLEERTPVDGTALVDADDSCCRHFRAADTSTGDDYVYTVTMVDTEGLRSAPASAATSAALYRVSYDGNGATEGTPPAESSYRQTKLVTVLGPGSMGLVGYVFVEWNTEQDGSGTAWAPGDTFAMGTEDVTLYARWAVAVHTVSFNSMGGSAVSDQAVVHALPAAEPDHQPTRPGFAFLGWFREAVCATSWDFLADTVTQPITLYAGWIALHSVTVTFTVDNPAYGVITFMPATTTVPWNTTVTFDTSLVGGSDWHWFVNNDDTGVTAATFVWDTSTVLPGQYIINVDAMYGGYPCSGWTRVTVAN